MPKPIPPEKFTVRYEEVPDRPYIPVNGAFGGPATSGSTVVAHLYSEFVSIPSRIDAEFDQRGTADLDKGRTTKASNVTRHIIATIVLAPDDAITIGTWLADKGKLAKENQAKIQAKQQQENEKDSQK